jgi:hypothetical protein
VTLVTDTPAGGDLRFAFDGATHWPADAPLRVLAGWCFGTGAAVRGVELRVGDPVRTADYRLPAAESSGSEVHFDVPPGRQALAVTGELGSGEILPLATGDRRRAFEFAGRARGAGVARAPASRGTATSRIRATGRGSPSSRGGSCARRRARSRGCPGGFGIPPVADRYEAWLEPSRPPCAATAR